MTVAVHPNDAAAVAKTAHDAPPLLPPPSMPAPSASPSPVEIKRADRRRGGVVQVKAAQLATKFSTRFAAPPPSSAMQIKLSPAAFRALWVAIVVFQLTLCIALLRAIYSNVWTLLDHEEIVVALRSFGTDYDGSVMIGTTLVTAASIYVNFTDVVGYVRCSIRHRRLVFHDPKARSPRHRSQFPKIQTPPSCTSWLRAHVMQLLAPAIGFSRACGIHGAFFDVGLYARELLEITLQTYQTVRVSYTVSEPWINNFAVGLVVANCWTTPLLDLGLSHNEPLRRAMCMTVDLLLDALSALALPMLVFASYRSKIATLDWFDPLWIMDAGNDLMYFHINTWLDLISRTMPSVSLVHCVHSITPMLVRRRSPSSASSRVSSRVSSAQTTSQASVRVASMVAVAPQPRPPRTPRARAVPVPKQRRKATLVHKLMLLYGAGIFAMGVLAQHGPQLSPVLDGCVKTTRPWLLGTERFPCAVLELNCALYPSLDDGSDDAFNARLDRTDRSALAALVIAHCPRARMPSQLAAFRNLVWLEVYNSTLLEWSEAAALTQARHPQMSRVVLVRVDVAPLLAPANLLFERLVAGPQLPASLLNVAIAASNLSGMAAIQEPPASVTTARARAGRRLQTLLLEDCALTTLPVFSRTTRAETVSLARNPLGDLNAGVNALRPTTILAPKTQLGNCSSVHLPGGVASTVFAAGAPICNASTTQRVACGPVTVDCSNKTAAIPLAGIDARRSLAERP